MPKKLKCESCDYSTDRMHNLSRHILSTHGEMSKLKPVNILFKCKHCTFCGRTIDGLNKHIISPLVFLSGQLCGGIENLGTIMRRNRKISGQLCGIFQEIS